MKDLLSKMIFSTKFLIMSSVNPVRQYFESNFSQAHSNGEKLAQYQFKLVMKYRKCHIGKLLLVYGIGTHQNTNKS